MDIAKNSFQLAVSQLMVTEAFYGGLLELPVKRSVDSMGMPDHLVLELEGVTVVFVEDQNFSNAHPVLATRFGMYPRGVGITLHFTVSNIESIQDSLAEEGMELLYPLEIKPYGLKEMWCFDPDGYLVVLEEAI